MIRAWYFSTAEKKLRYGDGRDIALGVTHTVDGTPSCCSHGLHGSEMIKDALSFAPGTICWSVELDGAMDKQSDKIAAQSRKYVAGGIEVLPVILSWSRRVALDVAHLWDMPDIVRKWLETGDESIRKEAYNAAAYYAAAYYAAAAAANAADAADDAADDAAAAYYAAAYYAAANANANANAADAAYTYAAKRKEYSQWLAEAVWAEFVKQGVDK